LTNLQDASPTRSRVRSQTTATSQHGDKRTRGQGKPLTERTLVSKAILSSSSPWNRSLMSHRASTCAAAREPRAPAPGDASARTDARLDAGAHGMLGELGAARTHLVPSVPLDSLRDDVRSALGELRTGCSCSSVICGAAQHGTGDDPTSGFIFEQIREGRARVRACSAACCRCGSPRSSSVIAAAPMEPLGSVSRFRIFIAVWSPSSWRAASSSWSSCRPASSRMTFTSALRSPRRDVAAAPAALRFHASPATESDAARRKDARDSSTLPEARFKDVRTPSSDGRPVGAGAWGVFRFIQIPVSRARL